MTTNTQKAVRPILPELHVICCPHVAPNGAYAGFTVEPIQLAISLPNWQCTAHCVNQEDEDAPAVDVSEPTRFPLPNTFRSVLSRHVGLTERITYSGIAALAPLAKEDAQLQELAGSYPKYSAWAGDVVVSRGDSWSVE